MKTMIAVLGAVSAIALMSANVAHAGAPENKTTYEAKDNGGYEVKSKSKAVNAAGTERTGERKVDVEIDDNGSKSKTVTTKSAVDAEGLMNGKEDKAETKMEMNADGSSKTVKSNSHSNFNGTDTSTEVETKVDANGNVITETEKTVDPKGLLNKSTTTTKTINGKVVK